MSEMLPDYEARLAMATAYVLRHVVDHPGSTAKHIKRNVHQPVDQLTVALADLARIGAIVGVPLTWRKDATHWSATPNGEALLKKSEMDGREGILAPIQIKPEVTQ